MGNEKFLGGKDVAEAALGDGDLANMGVEFGNDAGWDNDADTKLPGEHEILEPWGYKILVMPLRPRAISQGGILIPHTVQNTDMYLNYVGRIVALGPFAYKHAKYDGWPEGQFPKRGDWMLYPLYNYHRIDFKGTKLFMMNDDSFIGRIPEGVDPWAFKIER